MSTYSFGQVHGPATDVSYNQISNTEVKVVSTNECDKEIGYLKITKNKKLIRHGIWKSYCNGDLKMTALYKDGKLVWVETDKLRKITHTEITYLRNLGHGNTALAEQNELKE
jgi:hypothetical protein